MKVCGYRFFFFFNLRKFTFSFSCLPIMHMKGYEATAWGELKQLKTVFCSAGKQEVGEEEEEEDAGEGKLFLSIFLYI